MIVSSKGVRKKEKGKRGKASTREKSLKLKDYVKQLLDFGLGFLKLCSYLPFAPFPLALSYFYETFFIQL